MKYEFPNWIKQAEIFSKHLMNVPKTVRKSLTQWAAVLNNTQNWRVSHCSIWAVGCMTKELWSKFWQGNKFFRSPEHPCCVWGPSQLHVHVAHGVQWLWQEDDQSVCLVPRWACGPYCHLPIWLHSMVHDSAQGRLIKWIVQTVVVFQVLIMHSVLDSVITEEQTASIFRLM